MNIFRNLPVDSAESLKAVTKYKMFLTVLKEQA